MATYDCPRCASAAVQAYSQLNGQDYAYPERRGMGCGGWLCILMAIAGINAAVMLGSSHGIAVKMFALFPGAMALGFAYLAFSQSRVASRRYSESELTVALDDTIRKVALDNKDLLGSTFLEALPTKVYNAIQHTAAFVPEDDTVLTAVFGPQPEDSPIRASFVERLQEASLAHEDFDLDKAAIPRPDRALLVTAEGIEIRYSTEYSQAVQEIPLEDGRVEIRIESGGIVKREQYAEKTSRRR